MMTPIMETKVSTKQSLMEYLFATNMIGNRSHGEREHHRLFLHTELTTESDRQSHIKPFSHQSLDGRFDMRLSDSATVLS